MSASQDQFEYRIHDEETFALAARLQEVERRIGAVTGYFVFGCLNEDGIEDDGDAREILDTALEELVQIGAALRARSISIVRPQ
jgi:hypothetical protein